MNRRTITPTRLALAGASLALAGALVLSGALANDPPVTVPSTGEEPIGTPGTVTLPTPIWETVEATTASGEVVDVVSLPSTGSGTTGGSNGN